MRILGLSLLTSVETHFSALIRGDILSVISLISAQSVFRVFVGHFRLSLPLAFCTAVFFPRRVLPWESLHKTLINTVFCIQLSQIEFPHAYALLLQPASATKLTCEAIWKMSNYFRISLFEKKVAIHRSGKNHCGNFFSLHACRSSSVNSFRRCALNSLNHDMFTPFRSHSSLLG